MEVEGQLMMKHQWTKTVLWSQAASGLTLRWKEGCVAYQVTPPGSLGLVPSSMAEVR